MARRKNRKALEVVALIDCLSNELRVQVWQTINKLREHYTNREVLGWAARYIEAARQDALPPVPRLGRSKEVVREGVAESNGAEDVAETKSAEDVTN